MVCEFESNNYEGLVGIMIEGKKKKVNKTNLWLNKGNSKRHIYLQEESKGQIEELVETQTDFDH